MLPMQMKRILVVILLDSVIFFIPSLKLSPETEFCRGTATLQGHGTLFPYFVMAFVNIILYGHVHLARALRAVPLLVNGRRKYYFVGARRAVPMPFLTQYLFTTQHEFPRGPEKQVEKEFSSNTLHPVNLRFRVLCQSYAPPF